MTNEKSKNRQNDALFKDRLLRESIDALSTLYSAQRRLLAFTGSGLSLIYGGLTWNEAVAAIIEDTLAELKEQLEENATLPPTTAQRLRRHQRMLQIYLPSGNSAEPSDVSHEDKMVSLEVCEEARHALRRLDDQVRTANEYFADLVRDDALASLIRLADRFAGYPQPSTSDPGARVSEREYFLQRYISGDASNRQARADGIARFAASTYSRAGLVSLGAYISHEPTRNKLAEIREALVKELGDHGVTGEIFAIDRRSLIAPFLALLSPKQREAYADDLAASPPEKEAIPPARPLTDPLRRLVDPLLIKRFMTLNYDWELERLLMFPDRVAQQGRTFSIEDARDEIIKFDAREPGGLMTRRMPDGRYITSEVYEPNASGGLFEFALNSPDHAAYILHLHGRADHPKGMVARDPDYHRTYRREASNPRSLERALDVALTGNPILFVGIGMREAEITRAFRQLVAEGRVTPDRPAFVLRANSAKDDNTRAWREQAAFYQQFGLHVLPYGHPRRGAGMDLSKHNKLIEHLRELLKLKTENKTRKKIDGNEVDNAPTLVSAEDYAILASMPADMLLVNWIKSVIERPEAGMRCQLAVAMGFDEAPPECRTVNAIRGIDDYLQRLRTRLESQALAMELDVLAKDIAASVASGERLPVPREKARPEPVTSKDDYFLHLRHINPIKPDPRENTSSIIYLSGNKQTTFKEVLDQHPIGVVTAPQHAGKGALVRRIAGFLLEPEEEPRPTHILNLTFSVEVDGVIAQIYQFLQDCRLVDRKEETDRISRILQLTQNAAKPGARGCRLILTGLDRLFDMKGACISPDLESLLLGFVAANPRSPIRVILVGTPVIERWLAKIDATSRKQQANDREKHDKKKNQKKKDDDWFPEIHFPYRIFTLATADDTGSLGIIKKFEEILVTTQGNDSRLGPSDLRNRIQYRRDVADREIDRSERARRLLQILLDRWGDVLTSAPKTIRLGDEDRELGVDKVRINLQVQLDLDVLRFLSLVTAPVELSILPYVPRIQKSLKKLGATSATFEQALEASVARLAYSNLVVQVPSHLVPPGSPKKIVDRKDRKPRYALHRVVLSEMRERLGVPIGDALLSNTFTLSLASSLPVDVSVPGDDIRIEIEEILSHLRGAWKDAPQLDEGLVKLRSIFTELETNPHDSVRWAAEEALARLTRQSAMTKVDMHAALRASSNLMRSFFSATTLVMLTPESVKSLDRTDTPFDQHKRRIRKTFVTLAELQAIDKVGWDTDKLADDRMKEGFEEFAALLPDRVDELESIEVDLLGRFETYRSEPKLAPLYGGEVVWLHNERAVISLIQGDLYEATFSFQRALAANTAFKGEGRGNNRNRIDVNRTLLLIERGELSNARSIIHNVREDLRTRVPRERELLRPLTDGYLGLIAHLNGRSDEARRHYSTSIKGLIATEQLRALSLFQMRRAALLGSTGKVPDALEDVNAAIRSAEACCQIDVLWRARLLRSTIDPNTRERDHVGREAFLAAERLGLVRVSVEALMARAEAAMAGGNPDAAADFTALAMSRAMRSGMTLRRIALRVLMGRIMMRQRNTNGEWLIRRAIAHADRIGYQSCVQTAQEALLKAGGKSQA